MTIIKRRLTEKFAAIPNAVANDENLSFEALGMLTYLLAKPRNWTINVKDLQRNGKIGRDKVYKLLNQLKEAGYVQLIQRRCANGCIDRAEYRVTDQAANAKAEPSHLAPIGSTKSPSQYTDLPDPETPHTDLPDTVTQDALEKTNKTRKQKFTKQEETQTPRALPASLLGDTGRWHPLKRPHRKTVGQLLEEILE